MAFFSFILLCTLILRSVGIMDQIIRFANPGGSYQWCYFVEQNLRIFCSDSNYQFIELSILEEQIAVANTYQFPQYEFILSSPFYFDKNFTEFMTTTSNTFKIFQIQNGTATLKWQSSTAASTISYFLPVCDMQGIFYYCRTNYNLLHNTNNQTTTIFEDDFMIKGQENVRNKALSPDTYFLSFQNSTQVLKIFHLSYSNGRIQFAQEAEIPTTRWILGVRSAFSYHGEFFAFLEGLIIRMYQRNSGTNSYEPFQEIQKDSSYLLMNMRLTIDSLMIAYYSSGTRENFLQTFKILEGSPNFVETKFQKIGIEGMQIINVQENYTFVYSTTQTQIIYACPDGCTNCNAHRTCSNCEEGLKLEQGRCRKYDECFEYFDPSFSACRKFCDKNCKVCGGESPDQCLECNQLMDLNEGQCSNGKNGICLIAFYLTFKTIRIPRLRSAYIFIDNIELYQYHMKDYDGIFQRVLKRLHEIDEMIEDLMMSNQIQEYTQMERLSQYNHFTNPKFLSIERKSQLLFTNFIVSDALRMTLRVITFFILYLLFRMLFRFQISRYLRIYSFKLYLLQLIFCSSFMELVYLTIGSFRMLFNFFHTWMEQGALLFCIVYSVAFFMMSCSIFCIYHLFYGNFVKYFYTNLYRRPGAYLFSVLRYFGKPLLLGVIHSLLYENQGPQLLLLMAIESVSSLITILFSVKYDIFKIKMLLMTSLCCDWLMALLNMLAYLKINAFEEEFRRISEEGIQICIYGLIGLLCLEIGVNILDTIFGETKYQSVEKQEVRLKMKQKNDADMILSPKKSHKHSPKISPKEFSKPKQREQIKVQPLRKH